MKRSMIAGRASNHPILFCLFFLRKARFPLTDQLIDVDGQGHQHQQD
ncbi:MAG TPA: hypothetical protein VKB84_26485 [Candidatus Binataceae bacterium]|nr:hypothetical protein [Candidatus Binataceae bacterium]